MRGGQVVESTGLVVVPYMLYPQLLGVLLRILSEGSPAARLEVVKVRCTALPPQPPRPTTTLQKKNF